MAKKGTATKGLTVRDVMTADPVVATLPGRRTDVLRTLVAHKLTGLPVVGKDGGYAGFVARKHLFARPAEEQLAMLVVRAYPSVEPDTPLVDAAKRMNEGELHHLPVVSAGKVVGIVTPADLLGVVEGLDSDTAVEDVVRAPCVPVHEGTPVNVASDIMRLAKVFALPVLNDEGRLTGIITDRDVFNLSEVNGTAVMHDLGIATDEDAWTWEGLRNVMRLYYEEHKIDLPRRPVREFMVPKPVTVFRKTSVSEAAKIMGRHDFGQLPVVDSQDRLVAMLYELDVVAVLT
jgi:CBS domain-containing protein